MLNRNLLNECICRLFNSQEFLLYLKTLKKNPHKNCEPYFLLPSLPDWSQCWRVYTFRILYCGQITVCIDSYPLLRL